MCTQNDNGKGQVKYNVAGTDIAIDLGTSYVKIYVEKKGIVLREPAVIAVDTVTDSIIAVGEEAYRMIGRTSQRTAVVRPLCNGVISDFQLAQEVIRYYLKKISASHVFMPRVVVSVPCGITEVEKRAVVDAITLLFRQLKQDFKGNALKPQCERQSRARRSGIGFRRNGASGAGVALPAAFGAA